MTAVKTPGKRDDEDVFCLSSLGPEEAASIRDAIAAGDDEIERGLGLTPDQVLASIRGNDD